MEPYGVPGAARAPAVLRLAAVEVLRVGEQGALQRNRAAGVDVAAAARRVAREGAADDDARLGRTGLAVDGAAEAVAGDGLVEARAGAVADQRRVLDPEGGGIDVLERAPDPEPRSDAAGARPAAGSGVADEGGVADRERPAAGVVDRAADTRATARSQAPALSPVLTQGRVGDHEGAGVIDRPARRVSPGDVAAPVGAHGGVGEQLGTVDREGAGVDDRATGCRGTGGARGRAVSSQRAVRDRHRAGVRDRSARRTGRALLDLARAERHRALVLDQASRRPGLCSRRLAVHLEAGDRHRRRRAGVQHRTPERKKCHRPDTGPVDPQLAGDLERSVVVGVDDHGYAPQRRGEPDRVRAGMGLGAGDRLPQGAGALLGRGDREGVGARECGEGKRERCGDRRQRREPASQGSTTIPLVR